MSNLLFKKMTIGQPLAFKLCLFQNSTKYRHEQYQSMASILAIAIILVCGKLTLAQPPWLSLSNEQRQAKWAELDLHWKDAYRFDQRGKLEEALQAGQRALVVERELYGKRGTRISRALGWMAERYEYLGKFAKARQHRTQALKVVRNTYIPTIQGPEYWEVVDARVSLANIEVLEKLSPQQLDRLSEASRLLASIPLRTQAGKTAQAIEIARQVAATRKNILGHQHREYAAALHWTGYLLANERRPEESARLLAEALAIYRNVLGDEHPATRTTIDTLVPPYIQTGQYEKAERLCRATLDAAHQRLVANSNEPEQKQLSLKARLRHRLDSYLAIATLDGRYESNGYENLVAWKGMVLRQQQLLHAQIDNPEFKPLFRELADVDRKLAGLSLSRMSTEDGERQSQIDRLSKRQKELHRELSIKSATFPRVSKRITLDDVRSAMPAKSALVDFIEYWAYYPSGNTDSTNKPRPEWERRLLAFVIRRERPVRLIDLTDVATLESKIDAWRKRVKKAEADGDEGRWLRRTIWQPLESSLVGVEHVLVSPDGALGRLPFPALPGKGAETYLLEERTISIVPSAAGLVYAAGRGQSKPAAKNLLVVGGIDYDAVPIIHDGSKKAPLTRRAVRGSDRLEFEPLRATASELSAITKLYRDRYGRAGVTTLSGSNATETATRRESARHSYIHVATHGFFAPPSIRSALDAAQIPPKGRDKSVSGSNPELLSGIALAGANNPDDSGYDGILTAAEVRSLDLRRVELTVLSACETGLGKVAGGEGVLGLQRAFQVAGAHGVIASMWKVPDAETRDLMVRFYDNLWNKRMSKASALREAQLWMLNRRGQHETRTSHFPLRDATLDDRSLELRLAQNKRLPPFYWAAFVLSGDWR